MSQEVILMDDVEGLGDTGEIVKVSDGYARNYLLPLNLAAAVSAGTRRQVEKRKVAAEVKRTALRAAAEEKGSKIAAAAVVIKVKTGMDGKMFGSVTSSDIVEGLKDQGGIEVTRQQVEMGPHLKDLGEHVVVIRLYKDVKTDLKVSIVQE